MKYILTALMLLPLSSNAQVSAYRAIIAIRSLRAIGSNPITKEATIFLNKEHSELFDFSSPDTKDIDKITVNLLLHKIQDKKATVRYTVVEDRCSSDALSSGASEATKTIPMNVKVDINTLDPVDVLKGLYDVQFDLTLSE